MIEEIKQIPFSRKVLYLLTRKDGMTEEIINKYYNAAKFNPSGNLWYNFISKFILSLGILFMLSGIVFFFAYNWRDLHKYSKLGIVASLVLIPTAYSLFSNFHKFPTKLALMAISIFTGCLLAVFGQVYQTGANAYDLFQNWALLIFGIVLISKFPPLWFLWVILINTTIIMFAGQILRHWIDPYAFTSLFIFNTTIMVIWEHFKLKKMPLFQLRWFPRIVGFAALSSVTISAIAGIVTDFEEPAHLLCLFLAIASFVAFYFLYSKKIYDLSQIAFSCICIIALIFTSIIKASDFDASFMFFAGGIIIVGLTIGSTLLLIKTNELWKAKL